MPKPQTAICSGCNVEQPLEDFYRDICAASGRTSRCKGCLRRSERKRRLLRHVGRKPCMMVKKVIRRPRTREEIAIITGYPEEMIADVLAVLWDSGEARLDRRSRRWAA